LVEIRPYLSTCYLLAFQPLKTPISEMRESKYRYLSTHPIGVTMEADKQTKPRKSDLVRDNFMLPPDIRAPLAALSEKTGAPKSELVRRALRAYLAINCAEKG
jgi:hypothetical protein